MKTLVIALSMCYLFCSANRIEAPVKERRLGSFSGKFVLLVWSVEEGPTTIQFTSVSIQIKKLEDGPLKDAGLKINDVFYGFLDESGKANICQCKDCTSYEKKKAYFDKFLNEELERIKHMDKFVILVARESEGSVQKIELTVRP